ncbi:MAG: MBL fold metallo-hydrolase [Promethearchaeota archaeon]|jgi:7,8-dihydropterin-6-yl-methyl-4-(beta-D-ribofuranosyl)aminobenzene 5'-phosphate synthase
MQLAEKHLELENFYINILFNHGESLEGFVSSYGFAALVYNAETGNYILFDTGSDGIILLNNLNQLDIDVADISKVVISHNHPEHTKGLETVYKKNSTIEVYVPQENYVTYKRKYPLSKVYGVSEITEIEKNVYSTGQLGNYLKEQAMLLKTPNERGILLVGCCHPGLKEILNVFSNRVKIEAIIGGLHNTRVFSPLDSLKFIGACHCTNYNDILRVKYPEKYHEIKVGKDILF